MLVRLFEGNVESIKGVAKLLKNKNREFCIKKIEHNGGYAISVDAFDYIDCIELASKHLPKQIARGIDVVSPDTIERANLFFRTRAPFVNPREKKIVPVFESTDFESVDFLAGKLNGLGITVQAHKGFVSTIWAEQRNYIYAILLGSEISVLEDLNNIQAIAPDRETKLDKRELTRVAIDFQNERE